MYYDARPCGMNGIFKSYTYDRFNNAGEKKEGGISQLLRERGIID